MDREEQRYSVGELARLGGVSRRTVRYYVQENLLPPPLGRRRGDHYGEEHLQRLLQVKAMQERGMSLDAIRATVVGPPRPVPPPPPPPDPRPPGRYHTWTRVPVTDGVELHVAAGYPPPTPLQLEQMAQAIRSILAGQLPPVPGPPVVILPRQAERHEFEDPRPKPPPKPPAPEW